MKVKIKKDREWTNPADAKKHLAGAVLDLDDAKAKGLCDLDIAEAEAKASDVATVLDEAVAGLDAKITTAVAQAIGKAAQGFELKGKGLITGGADRADDDPMNGFKCDDEFYLAVHRSSQKGAAVDERLPKVAAAFKHKMLDRYPQLSSDHQAMAKVASVGTGEAGGFLVPEETSSRIFERVQAQLGGVVEKCDRLTLSGFSVRMPAASDASRAVAATRYGGIIVYNVADEAQITASNPKWREIRLEVHKKAALAGVTEEMLSAVANFGSRLTTKMGEAIGDEVVEDIFFGSGAGVCLGAFAAANPACLAIAKEADQEADTIVVQNILKMEAYLYGSGEFYYNPEAHTQLAMLTLTVGTSGIPLMMSAGGFSGAPSTTIRGRAATNTDHCEKLGDAGDIVLANWSQYMLATRGGIKTDMSIHLWFDYDKTAFKATFEVDGRPAWESTLTPRKGATGTRVSPFLKVAERA